MSDSGRSVRRKRSESGLASGNSPSADALHSHRQLEEGNKAGTGKRGRPVYGLKQGLRRSLLRLYVTTPEPLAHIQDALEKAGGPRKQWVRQWLEEVTGVKYDPDFSLDDIRLNDPRAKRQREREQQHAHDMDQTRRNTGAPRARGADPQFHGPIRPSFSENLSGSSRKPAVSEALNESQELVQGSLDDRARDATSNGEPSGQSGSRYTTEPFVGHDEVVGAFSGIPGPVSPVFARRAGHRTSQNNVQPASTAVRPGNQRRVSTISASSVVRCLVSKKRSLCSFVAKRASISVFSVPSRASTGRPFSLSRLARPSLYQQFYTRPEASKGNDAATPRLLGDLVNRTDFATGTASPQTAVELLVSSRLDFNVQHLLQDKLNDMPDSDERHAFVRAPDHRGVTALHLAVAYGYPATCGLLLKNGADYEAKTCQGDSPRDFARSAEKVAGKHECLTLYCRIMLCRDRVKYNIAPPAPRPQAEDSDFRPPKRRMTSQTAKLGHQSRSKNTSSSSLRRTALTKMTNDEAFRSFSAEDVSAMNTPRGSLDHGRGSIASTTSLIHSSAAQTQESLLAFGHPYTDSPQASTRQDHPLRAESSFDFATSPASIIPTGSEAPPWPTNRAQGFTAGRTNPSEFQTVPYGQGTIAQTQPSMYSQDINHGFSSQRAPAFDPVTSAAAFDDTVENLPTVLSANTHGSDHIGFGSDIEDWSQFSDQYDFVSSQNAAEQTGQTFSDPTMEQLNQHSNYAGSSNSASATTFTAPPDQGTTQPSTFVPTYAAQTLETPDFIPTPLQPTTGLDANGSQPIWYNCSHNNPTSTRMSYCPMGCTVLDAILSQTSNG